MHSNGVCYVCGYQGTTEIAHTRPNNNAGGSSTSNNSPCFPSLLLVPPAPSSKPPASSDGHVRLCGLCVRLLLEQWNSYEKRKTPLSNRQYWFKSCSSNRDVFQIGSGSRLNSDQGPISEVDGVERASSQSISPNTCSDDARDPIIPLEKKNSRGAGKSTAPKPKGADSKSTVVDKLTCIVCCGSIESIDVCRRLPAHLVAHITDLNPNRAQASERIGSLTGEVLVCDDCFASSSFQTAWLECCRRGSGSMHLASSSCNQHAIPESKRDEGSSDGTRTVDAAAFQVSIPGTSTQHNFTDAQRQWFALYERALLQFHFTGQLDPIILSQLQQLAAAETLASLQHSCSTENTDG